MTARTHSVPTDTNPTPRALVVSIQLPSQSSSEVQTSAAELRALLLGLGIDVVDSVVQRRPAPGSLGAGRIAALARRISGRPESDEPSFDDPLDEFDEGDELVERDLPDTPEGEPLVDLAVFDTELAPGDARRMERALGVTVLDRTQVILRVFQERAQTREAQLEIELAQLGYDAPRVRDSTVSHGRVGGGGRGGKGHTGAALTKQRIRERSALLSRQLEEVQRTRAAQSARRADTFRVALVGYTNAGKSSLMRALTGSEVLVRDQLFATLGTTVRTLQPETTPRILLSDTVGFIRNLPHALVASFRATLSEAREAALLLTVVDAADPEATAQLDVTKSVLAELGGGDIPSLLVWNKIDRVSADRLGELEAAYPEANFTSAHSPESTRRLRDRIVAFFDANLVEVAISVPYRDLSRVSELRGELRFLEERYDEAGLSLRALGTESALARLVQRSGWTLERVAAAGGAERAPRSSEAPATREE